MATTYPGPRGLTSELGTA